MRYYIADLHFFHETMNDRMDCRGFYSIEEMNGYIVDKWNGKVRESDEVIILGDVSLGGAKQTNELLKHLKGKLYLIRGNHDRFVDSRRIDAGLFQWIKPYEELSDNKRKVILCHYPILFYNGQYRLDDNGNPKTYMLYGHVHDSRDQRLLEQFQEMVRNTSVTDAQGNTRTIPCNMLNCFCMYSDYEPLTLDEWIECHRKRKEGRVPDASLWSPDVEMD